MSFHDVAALSYDILGSIECELVHTCWPLEAPMIEQAQAVGPGRVSVWEIIEFRFASLLPHW